jgi:hypothetical protein
MSSPAASLAPRSEAPTFEELAKACRFGRVNGFSLPAVRPSGFQELDRALPIGGWPVGALTELMPRTAGIGELRLVMPALAKLTQERRHIAFIEPPHLPYPPALAQQGVQLDRALFVTHASPASSLWAAEQMLRCAAFGAILLWIAAIGDKELRRLQLAAEAGKTLAFLYRPPAAALQHSPAALRLCLQAAERKLSIEIKKCRGGVGGGIVHCVLEKEPDPLVRDATDKNRPDTPASQVA